MLLLKSCLVFFGLTGFQFAMSHRVIRSPDKMELDVPNQSWNRESGEYQSNMKDEANYWQGQGDKLDDKANEGHEQLDEDREKNKETYEHEKEHYHEQQNEYNNEMNEAYQEDRDKAEAHHHNNQEHLHEHSNQRPDGSADDLHPDKETSDRYEEKGQEYVNDREGQMENYEMNGNPPSFTYTRETLFRSSFRMFPSDLHQDLMGLTRDSHLPYIKSEIRLYMPE